MPRNVFCLLPTPVSTPGQSLHGPQEIFNPDADRLKAFRGDDSYVNVAEAAIIYVLTDIVTGTQTTRQLDLYGSLNGYCIRTIPGTRWQNPVNLGAGSDLIAVVDRFNDYDVIRITDEFGGAGAGAFNLDGSPKLTVNWSSIPDICTLVTPKGYRVAGCTISDSGMLIASLSAGDGNSYLLRADITARITGTKPFAASEGIVTNDGFAYGNAAGNSIALYDPAVTSNLLIAIFPVVLNYASGPTVNQGGAAAVAMRVLTGEVLGVVPLGSDLTPIGIVQANNVVSVMMGTSGVGVQTLRFSIDKFESMIANLDPDTVPKPWDGSDAAPHLIKAALTPQDFKGGINPELSNQMLTYTRYSDYVNNNGLMLKRREVTTVNPDGTISVEDYDNGSGMISPNTWQTVTGGGSLTVPEDRTLDDRNDARTQVAITLRDTYLLKTGNARIPVAAILLTDAMQIVALTGSGGVGTELLSRKDTTGAIDPTLPVYRLIHSRHFDLFGDGGYTYGCYIDGVPQARIANSGTPVAVAAYKNPIPGKLRELKDVAIAFVDRQTGKFVSRYAKPLGIPVFSGSFASATLSKDEAIATPCTQAIENLVTQITGLSFPGQGQSATYLADWYNAIVVQPEFSLLEFRILLLKTLLISGFSSDSWTQRDNSGAFLPGLNWHNMGNALTTFSSGVFRYSAPNSAAFYASGFGGAYFLDHPKIFQRDSDVLRAQIAAATDDSQRASLQQQLANLTADNVRYVLSRGYQNLRCGPLDLSPALPVSATGFTNESPAPPAVTGAHVGDVLVIPDASGDLLRRAVVVEPDVRSWVAIEIKLDRDDVFTDGVDTWVNPLTPVNGLGQNIASCPTFPPTDGFGLTGASAYESAYFASGGSQGAWEIEITADGKPIAQMASLVTFDEQVAYLAPSEMQDAINACRVAAGGVNPFYGYHKGRAYFSNKTLNKITVKVRLVNYAYDVYRVGYRTVDHYNLLPNGQYVLGTNVVNEFENGYICVKNDPGFFADNLCEALGCGNVGCGSFIFYGRKLQRSDPIYKLTRQVLWEGQMTSTYANDPYAAKNIVTGRYFNIYFDFALNAPMNRFPIDIRQGIIGSIVPGEDPSLNCPTSAHSF